MKMKNLAIVLLFLMLLATTAGCDRIASIPPIGVAATPTNGAVNFPVDQSSANPTDVAKILGTTVSKMAKDLTPTTAPLGSGASTATSTPTNTPTAAPSATATAIPATAVPVTPVTYALSRGEWAICIARRYNLDINPFFAINHINMNTNTLPVGYVLALPSGTSWNGAYGPRYWHAHPATYSVMPGDTINHIACFYGDVSPAAIEAANGLSGSYSLSVGQTLSIP
jgi:LysM repeat protein